MIPKKKSKKAQSGMEYLITYGWAILIVGIVLLLLLSLRVLDVDWWSVSNEVWGLSTFAVPDFKATPYVPSPGDTSVLLFQLINNKGTNVTIYDVAIKDSLGVDHSVGFIGGVYVWYCPTQSTCTFNTSSFPFNMTPGQRMVLNGTMGMPGDINTVFTTKIQIQYTSPRSNQTHTDTGMMRGRVEPD
jgi:hypothetical protein